MFIWNAVRGFLLYKEKIYHAGEMEIRGSFSKKYKVFQFVID
jgi:hypothetical protein